MRLVRPTLLAGLLSMAALGLGGSPSALACWAEANSGSSVCADGITFTGANGVGIDAGQAGQAVVPRDLPATGGGGLSSSELR